MTSTATASPRTMAETYFQSWKDKDFDALRSLFSDDVTFRGPLGNADGVDECVDGMRGLAKMITDIRVLEIAVDGDDVITWYELHTKDAPPVATANWSHVEDGKISRIQAVFDPRPLVG